MTENDKEIEAEAAALFNCDKSILEYVVDSAGSIGPSKLSQAKSKTKTE